MTNSILKYLTSWFSVTTYILTTIGGGVLFIMNPEGLTTAFIPIVALVVNLLIGFLIPDLWKKHYKFRRRLRIAAIILVISFLVITFASIAIFSFTTFPAQGREHKMVQFVRGDVYSGLGREYEALVKEKEASQFVTPDDILQSFGQDQNPAIWEERSFKRNRLIVIYTILVVMISFVTSISFFAVVYVTQEDNKSRKTGNPVKSTELPS